MPPSRVKTIFANSLAFLQFFLSSSTVHGLSHMADKKRHFLETLAWFLLVLFSAYWVGNLSGLALMRYVDNPTVISMERDYFSWNTTFPAATICPHQKIDEVALRSYVENSEAENKTALEAFLRSLAGADFDGFVGVEFYDGIKAEDYMEILLGLQVQFEPEVICEKVKCELQRSITEMGVCYSFNSQLAAYNSPEYREKGMWGFLAERETLEVNPLDGDIFTNIVNISSGSKLYIHGPYEVADVATKTIELEQDNYLQLYLSALSIFSTERVKRLLPRQRKCRYYDESDLPHSPVYSYVLCRMECRIKLSKRLCGCVPHFYRKLDGESTCDVTGLHCLSKYSERLKTLRNECTCLPNCDDVNYIVEEHDMRPWFLGTNLQFGLKTYPRMRLKRDLIFGFTDVLVYIGGLAGLFLGCSVLSFIEFFYIFTFRLYWFVRRRNGD